ncbi:preprotein translocase subunit SecE [Caldithrix abyssi]|uniref:Protein translocase subunit SecE n=1 Tax=Caldithrix abyssi DSM 13497 TaxID=880073 RepID=H1XVG5_CALAY|nr:secE protein translocase subunit secE/sec61 gamma [Caldithrix abyssi DSM 13497]EHO41723.1 preprotein translocase, SecE subunit [Caldithrix abyssi DSM 13497]
MFKKIKKFLDEVKVEMSKVSWPSHQELVNSTLIVVVVSLLFTAYIFLADLLISQIVKIFY